MSDFTLDDLLDGMDLPPPSEAPVRRGRGRPPKPKSEVPPKPEAPAPPVYHGDIAKEPEGAIAFDEDFDFENAAFPSQGEFHRPVGVTFLATIAKTEPRRIHKLLAKCPIVGYGNYQGRKVSPLYDFWTAMAYLVEPKIDLVDWLQTQTAITLPPAINKAFWDAMNSKQRWQHRAGELWHTSDVLEVFGKVAMLIKETTQLWVENLPGKADMTDAQYNALTGFVTTLQGEIYEALVELPKKQRTESSARSLDDALADAEARNAEKVTR